MSLLPRPHQTEAIKAAVTGFKRHDIGQVIMACGTGKTLTTYWIAQAIKAKRTIVFVPSLALLAQTLREWERAWANRKPHTVLCVCSDQSVGSTFTDELHVEVKDLGFPVTNDVPQIAKILATDASVVVFCTYHSARLIEQAQSEASLQPFDLMIADEGHRCAGDEDSTFRIPTDPERILAKKRLYTTATPKIYSQNEDYSTRAFNLGMNNTSVFGPVFFRLGFGEAIKRGLLTDYEVVVLGVHDSDAAALLKGDASDMIDKEGYNLRNLAVQSGLLHAIGERRLRKIITFHSRVAAAQLFSQQMEALLRTDAARSTLSGLVSVDYMHGEMPMYERQAKLDCFTLDEGKFETKVLANARCLAEGIDVPAVDAVTFVDPRGGVSDIVQIVGRALRKSESKTVSTIIVPVFLNPDEEFEHALSKSNFKSVLDVISALQSHDEELTSELTNLRRLFGANRSTVLPEAALEKVQFSITGNLARKFEMYSGLPIDAADTSPPVQNWGIGSEVSIRIATVARPKIEINVSEALARKFQAAIRTRVVEEATPSWEYRFGELEAFSTTHGHCILRSHSTSPEIQSLASWLERQIALFVKGNLSTERADLLRGLGVVFETKNDIRFRAKLNELAAFKRRYRNFEVPRIGRDSRATSPNPSLWSWIQKQKDQAKDGTLLPHHRSQLEAIGLLQRSRKKAEFSNEAQAAMIGSTIASSVCRIVIKPLMSEMVEVRLSGLTSDTPMIETRSRSEKKWERATRSVPNSFGFDACL